MLRIEEGQAPDSRLQAPVKPKNFADFHLVTSGCTTPTVKCSASKQDIGTAIGYLVAQRTYLLYTPQHDTLKLYPMLGTL